MTTSPLRQELRIRLTQAMRAKDRAVASVIRSMLGTLENAEAVPAATGATTSTSEHVAGAVVGVGAGEARRRELTSAEERELVALEVAELRAAAEECATLGATQRAEELQRAALLLDAVMHDQDGGAEGRERA